MVVVIKLRGVQGRFFTFLFRNKELFFEMKDYRSSGQSDCILKSQKYIGTTILWMQT